MVVNFADGDAGGDGPFDRDVLATAMAMIERYGPGATWRARKRVAWLSGPRDTRARLLWTHVVAAIAFLEAIARWGGVAASRQ